MHRLKEKTETCKTGHCSINLNVLLLITPYITKYRKQTLNIAIARIYYELSIQNIIVAVLTAAVAARERAQFSTEEITKVTEKFNKTNTNQDISLT